PGARIGVLLDQYRDRQPQHRDQGHLQSALAEAPARLSRRLLLDHEPPQKHARHDQRRLPRHRYINRADQKDGLCSACRGDWWIGGICLCMRGVRDQWLTSRAMAKAAAAASEPISAVCKALRTGATPVISPLTPPKIRSAARVSAIETGSACETLAKKK